MSPRRVLDAGDFFDQRGIQPRGEINLAFHQLVVEQELGNGRGDTHQRGGVGRRTKCLQVAFLVEELGAGQEDLVFLGIHANHLGHDLCRLIGVAAQESLDVIPGPDHAHKFLALGLEGFVLHHQQVGHHARHIAGGEQGTPLAAGLDIDAFRFDLFLFRKRQGQNTILKIGLDRIPIHVRGQCDAAREHAVATLMQVILFFGYILFLFHFTFDGQGLVMVGHLDIIGLDPGQ